MSDGDMMVVLRGLVAEYLEGCRCTGKQCTCGDTFVTWLTNAFDMKAVYYPDRENLKTIRGQVRSEVFAAVADCLGYDPEEAAVLAGLGWVPTHDQLKQVFQVFFDREPVETEAAA